MGLAAAAILVGGCDSGSPDEQRAENRRLQAEIIDLKKEINDLRGQASDAGRYLATEKAVTARLGQELGQSRAGSEKLKADYDQMKADFDRLQVDLRRAAADAGRADPDPAATARAPGAKTPKAIRVRSKEDDARIRELEMQEPDVKDRIAQMQATIGLTRSKISSLAKATVDVKAVVPPSGMVKDGQIWRRERVHSGTVTNPTPTYRFVPIGPDVVKGDFSSVREKNAAINAAKAELAPLLTDLRALESELAAVRKELADLRSSDP